MTIVLRRTNYLKSIVKEENKEIERKNKEQKKYRKTCNTIKILKLQKK